MGPQPTTQVEEIEPTSTVEVTPNGKPLPSPKSSRRSSTPEFKLSDDLSGFAELVNKSKTAEPSKVQEAATPLTPELNEAIHIDQAQFQQALEAYGDELRGRNKMNLAAALSQSQHILTHNKWCCLANNELERDLIEQDKDLLAFLRNILACNELFLELSLSETPQSTDIEIPYSPEEKLKAMTQINPALKKLQKLFNARIIYK